MTYIVQVWDPSRKDGWDSIRACDVEADAIRSAMAMSPERHQRVRIIAMPDEMDVVWALQDLQQQGIVDVSLVEGKWRWTLRECVA